MKLVQVSICILLPSLVIGRVLLPLSPPYFTSNHTSAASFNNRTTGHQPPIVLAAAGDPASPTTADSTWNKYVCRGVRLHNACKAGRDKAGEFVTPLDAPFDSTLEDELAYWGYVERNEEAVTNCWLQLFLKEELAALGINPQGSDYGGPNECFMFQHYDERARDEEGLIPVEQQTYEVDDRTYRATKAYAVIGANAVDGVIYFFNVKSAVEGAKEAWKVENPAVDQLPELRQISHMAWGIWRRKHPEGKNLGNINKFFVNHIINPITTELVAQALKTYRVGEGRTRVDRVPTWPGLIFAMDTEEGAAMLGSPNGIAIGYFLSQHKTQLGGNKYVSKVQVYLNSDGDDQPYMIFWVDDMPNVVSKGRPR